MSLEIRAGRRTVEISRPDKALFPCGITKADLAHYYERVAGAMLPHLADRPLNLERYPDGIERQRIMQQRASEHFPSWVRRVQVPKKGGTVDHAVASEPATLVYLAGQACITIHPWLSRADHLDRPDRIIFDLDPSGDDVPEVARGALAIGEILRELALEPWVMTSGSRGYHVLVPLQRRADHDAVREFARGVAELAATRHLEMPGAPVATPLRWEELSDPKIRPDRFTIADVPARLERAGDAWADLRRHAQSLGEARRRLERALERES
jgi:bifunctional non-homologous end joining protein LigD